MANYAVSNSTVSGFGSTQAPMTSTYKTLCGVAASTGAIVTYPALRRGKVYDILVGTNGTPADNELEFAIQRATISATGISGSAVVGNLSSGSSGMALDPADATCGGYFFVNSSNEGNVSLIATPTPWYISLNQRASFRWVAAPGSEILYPAASSATGTNGLVLQGRSAAYTGTATGTVLVSEQ